MKGTSRRTKMWIAAVTLTVTFTAALQAQTASTGAPDLVSINFYAVTDDGRPVPDLQADAVTLRLDGKPRTVRRLVWVPSVAPDHDPPPVPFGTNETTDGGRSFALVVDEDSFRPGNETRMRESAARFLVELKAHDRVAVVTVPYGGVKTHFTTDHREVARMLTTIVGRGLGGESGSDVACRSRRTLETLESLLDGFQTPETPITVVFFSSALFGPRRDAPVTLAPGPCEITSDMFRTVGVSAGAARAFFYLIQPEEVLKTQSAVRPESIAGADFIGSDNPLEGLEHLAGVTGGVQLQITTSTSSGLERIGLETGGYYVASVDAAPSDRNGKSHQLDVKLSRAGVLVRSTPTITFPRTDPRRARSTDPRAILRDPKTFRDLPLRAIGYPSSNGDGNTKILAIVEPVDPAAKLTAAAAGLFDAGGKLVAQWTANNADLAAPIVMTALVVPPGTYRLRVAAVDAAKRTGTVDYEVAAALTPAGPLTISGLVLGLSRGGGFVPRMAFAAEPVAIGFLELYGPRPAAPVSVTLEVGRTLNGPALLRVPGAVSASSDANRHTVTAALPIGALPAGDYIVRAVVGVEGQPAGRVSRTLRKVAQP